MKRYVAFIAAFGALALIVTPATGAIEGEDRAEIIFEKGKVPEGVAWSPKFLLTDAGLVSPKAKEGISYEVWIQTQKIPVGLYWRPPNSVNITLSVNGISSDGFPLQAYVHYGCDGVHWSTWYYMPESDKPSEESLKTYNYELRLPQVAIQPYRELMREWWITEPDWSSDEDAFCRWLARKNPDFFIHEFPFIGYVQFHLEDWGLKHKVKVKSLSARMSWGVGGIASIPKSGEQMPENKKWYFEIQEIKKENSKDILDQSTLKEAIHDYLQSNMESPSFGGKVFCAYDLFGSEITDDRIYIYLWTLCMEYYLEDGELKKGTGFSGPVALIALWSEKGYKIIQHKQPTDGEERYYESIKEIFPEKYRINIFPEVEEYNKRADNLLKQTERQAKMHYNLE